MVKVVKGMKMKFN